MFTYKYAYVWLFVLSVGREERERGLLHGKARVAAIYADYRSPNGYSVFWEKVTTVWSYCC